MQVICVRERTFGYIFLFFLDMSKMLVREIARRTRDIVYAILSWLN